MLLTHLGATGSHVGKADVKQGEGSQVQGAERQLEGPEAPVAGDVPSRPGSFLLFRGKWLLETTPGPSDKCLSA